MLEDRQRPLWLENLYNGLKTGSGEVAPVLKISRDGRKDEVFILLSNFCRLSQLMSCWNISNLFILSCYVNSCLTKTITDNCISYSQCCCDYWKGQKYKHFFANFKNFPIDRVQNSFLEQNLKKFNHVWDVDKKYLVYLAFCAVLPPTGCSLSWSDFLQLLMNDLAIIMNNNLPILGHRSKIGGSSASDE